MSIKFNDKVYDILKNVAQIVLPALSVAYAAIGKIWGFPYIVEIPATITAVDTFLGALLMMSSNQYQKEKSQVQD